MVFFPFRSVKLIIYRPVYPKIPLHIRCSLEFQVFQIKHYGLMTLPILIITSLNQLIILNEMMMFNLIIIITALSYRCSALNPLFSNITSALTLNYTIASDFKTIEI